jgi:hypothetical protein
MRSLQIEKGENKMTTDSQKKDNAEDQARAQFESIKEMVQALLDAQEADDENAREEAYQTIQEDPLSVEVRSGWHAPGAKADDEEFNILLCTGGPAVRIIGELDDYHQPDKARIEYQDWFTPWEEYRLDNEEDREILLAYCRAFYFGE